MRKYSRSKPVPPLTQGHLETNRVGVLLGDSGYALKPYLITPKLQPSSRQEEKYNEAHKDGRVVVERAFSLLKSRFRCLHKSGGSLQFRPGKCEKIVVACARLHNMCVDRNIAEPDGQFINDIADDQIVPVFAGTAIDYRRNVINMF